MTILIAIWLLVAVHVALLVGRCIRGPVLTDVPTREDDGPMRTSEGP